MPERLLLLRRQKTAAASSRCLSRSLSPFLFLSGALPLCPSSCPVTTHLPRRFWCWRKSFRLTSTTRNSCPSCGSSTSTVSAKRACSDGRWCCVRPNEAVWKVVRSAAKPYCRTETDFLGASNAPLVGVFRADCRWRWYIPLPVAGTTTPFRRERSPSTPPPTD